MKKKMFLVIFLFVFLLFINSVSANFVCGEAEYSKYSNPSWLTVRTYYSENPNIFAYCKISPENMKYCCDPLEIANMSWQVGKIMYSEMYDTENGYFSNISSLIISGEGYDVFPKIFVQKGVETSLKKVYLNGSAISFNISSANVFNVIGYSFDGQETKNVCDNCNNATLLFEDVGFGLHKLKINTANYRTNYSEEFNFSILENYSLSRMFSCDGCTQTRIPSGSRVNVNLILDLSHSSSGKLIEFVPVEFGVLSDGVLEPFSDTHNMLKFDVDGSKSVFNYTLVSPNTIFSKKYVFGSSFEDIFDFEQNITLSRFRLLDIFARTGVISKIDENLSEYKTFIKVSPNEPLVYNPNISYIKELAIFTNNTNKNVNLMISDGFIPNEISNTLLQNTKAFSFKTNINIIKVKEMYFKFELNNSQFPEPKFYFYDLLNDKMDELNGTFIGKDDSYSYYQVENIGYGAYIITDEGDNYNDE